MRTLLAVGLIVAGGCSLHFGGTGDDGGDDTGPPDARPPASDATPADPCDVAVLTCEDGVVSIQEYPGQACADYDPPREIFTCAGPCTTDYWPVCFSSGCGNDPAELCADPDAAPLPPTLGCANTGPTCPVDGAQSCGGYDACGGAVITGACTCDGADRSCETACADGLCSASAVQAALAGTWTGVATTPWSTNTVTFTFTADGHYATELPGEGAALYYGTDGGGDARRFHVIGQTSFGATAVVRVFFGSFSIQDGLARSIRIWGDRLTFDVWSAWLDCTYYGSFELTRVN